VRAETKADPAVIALAEPYHVETEAWLSRPIGTSARSLGATTAHLEDSALLDLIHAAQLEAGEADVSFAANFNLRATIPAGPITVRDIASLYLYENTLYVIEATGAQVKAALEHSSRYFRTYEEGKSAGQLIDPEIPGYNFDIAEGVSYEIDLRRPIGDRILNLKFKGEPLAPDRVLRVSINNYRYNGGGGFTMFKDAKVLARSSAEIRDLIIDWVERHGEIPAEPSGNWRIVP
jgi:2',3'-cyclic-nucleotide 2'-phosphodiesterase/3'-nucleotidase